MKKYNLLIGFFLILSNSFGQTHPTKSYSTSHIKNVIRRDSHSTAFEAYKKQALNATRILPKGYSIEGKVDYTLYLQKAIDSTSIVLLPNFPILISDKGLTLRDNQVLLFQENTRLVLLPSSKQGYSVLSIYQISNVKVYFPTLFGDRNRHHGVDGQWGFGINIKASKDVEIVGANIQNMWGDGIYIGQHNNIPSKLVKITNSFINNNRRNGISITSGRDIHIMNSFISNTHGHSPQSGIDIEPNSNEDMIKNISISDVITENNKWSGILIVLEMLNGESRKNIDININNHTDRYSEAGLAIHGYRKDKLSSNLSGTISVRNSTYMNNKKYDVYFYKSNLSKLKIETDNPDLRIKFNSFRLK